MQTLRPGRHTSFTSGQARYHVNQPARTPRLASRVESTRARPPVRPLAPTPTPSRHVTALPPSTAPNSPPAPPSRDTPTQPADPLATSDLVPLRASCVGKCRRLLCNLRLTRQHLQSQPSAHRLSLSLPAAVLACTSSSPHRRQAEIHTMLRPRTAPLRPQVPTARLGNTAAATAAGVAGTTKETSLRRAIHQ